MTAHPDTARETLKRIAQEFSSFMAATGGANEADTRVNLIDKILTQVCFWPEAAIKREQHVDRGYIDYSLLVQTRRYIAVEAKREGITFTFPTDRKSTRLNSSHL